MDPQRTAQEILHYDPSLMEAFRISGVPGFEQLGFVSSRAQSHKWDVYSRDLCKINLQSMRY